MDGFKNVIVDTSLFNKCCGLVIIVLLVYVDDIHLIGSNPFILQLHVVFPLKDLASLYFFPWA